MPVLSNIVAILGPQRIPPYTGFMAQLSSIHAGRLQVFTVDSLVAGTGSIRHAAGTLRGSVVSVR
jgi:hypothetical protein